MITREFIITELKSALEPFDFVYAMWLEGADANGTVDEFSDLDIYIDFEDVYEYQAIEAVEKALSSIAEIEYKYIIKHSHSKLRQRIYHIKNTSEFLMIDFCWQLHSRDKCEYTYVNGDIIEAVKVLFDKASIIQYKDEDKSDYVDSHVYLLAECNYRYSQHCRVTKYILRNQFAEAYAYYNKYVIEPLVVLLRMIYTPSHTDYYLIHISHHIPKPQLERLVCLLKISDLADIKENIVKAQQWFNELIKENEKDWR